MKTAYIASQYLKMCTMLSIKVKKTTDAYEVFEKYLAVQKVDIEQFIEIQHRRDGSTVLTVFCLPFLLYGLVGYGEDRDLEKVGFFVRIFFW